MSGKRSVAVVCIVGLAALWLMPTDALARAERIDYTLTFNTHGVVPGKTWYSADGKIQHVRGQVHYNTFFSDEPLIAGEQVQFTNYDRNMETGEATVTAKWELIPSAFPDGKWVGTVQGKLNFNTGKHRFHAVAQGTGSLKGMMTVQRWEGMPAPGYILVRHGM